MNNNPTFDRYEINQKKWAGISLNNEMIDRINIKIQSRA
jgi:hypothetical protein